MSNGSICECGFQFSGPGEFRNCEAFVTDKGQSGIICPKCNQAYVNGKKVVLDYGAENEKGSS